MNKAEIANLFIKAAVIDSRPPIDARPKRLKGASLPFFHTEQDIKERRVTGIRGGKHKEPLLPGDDPLDEWRTAFWASLEERISRNDVRLWELANELVTLVADEGNRRALWAWAMSKVGTLKAHEAKERQTGKFGSLSPQADQQKPLSILFGVAHPMSKWPILGCCLLALFSSTFRITSQPAHRRTKDGLSSGTPIRFSRKKQRFGLGTVSRRPPPHPRGQEARGALKR